MTEREAFKVGFLLRCTERGLNPEQTCEMIKQSDLSSLLGSAAGYGIPLALLTGIGAPLAAGYGGGHLLAKAREDNTNIDQLQNDEMVDEYQRLTDQIQRQQALRKMRNSPTTKVV